MKNTIIRCLILFSSPMLVSMYIPGPHLRVATLVLIFYFAGLWAGIDIQKARQE